MARRILDARGLGDVAVESTPGMLSDHYHPRTKTLRLSQNVYFAPTVAAAGIAAHEAGHAIQDADPSTFSQIGYGRSCPCNRELSQQFHQFGAAAIYFGTFPLLYDFVQWINKGVPS